MKSTKVQTLGASALSTYHAPHGIIPYKAQKLAMFSCTTCHQWCQFTLQRPYVSRGARLDSLLILPGPLGLHGVFFKVNIHRGKPMIISILAFSLAFHAITPEHSSFTKIAILFSSACSTEDVDILHKLPCSL